MDLFVDTSVWSLALRRDARSDEPAVERLRQALETGEGVFTTGLVVQELLQGFRGPKARDAIVERFGALPLLVPDRTDHIGAAELRNACRRNGVQVGTIDALLAQLCRRHDLVMLTTDRDFERVARHVDLRLWSTR
ncbi:MAG TPA: PIN domain-containing protein [Anaerolineae bacterium]|nr:PIN domain-containing protein [Anaerolineae bacterium]